MGSDVATSAVEVVFTVSGLSSQNSPPLDPTFVINVTIETQEGSAEGKSTHYYAYLLLWDYKHVLSRFQDN